MKIPTAFLAALLFTSTPGALNNARAKDVKTADVIDCSDPWYGFTSTDWGYLNPRSTACGAMTEENSSNQAAQRLTMDEVPPPVKATIEQESKGGTLKEIDKLSQDGKTAYEVEIVMNGKGQQIDIAEDGKVIKHAAIAEDYDDDD